MMLSSSRQDSHLPLREKAISLLEVKLFWVNGKTPERTLINLNKLCFVLPLNYHLFLDIIFRIPFQSDESSLWHLMDFNLCLTRPSRVSKVLHSLNLCLQYRESPKAKMFPSQINNWISVHFPILTSICSLSG